MTEKTIRRIYYYKGYYLDFFNKLEEKVKKKLNWTLRFIATHERIPVKYFEHLKDSGGLYEIKVDYLGNQYRVFSFFDKDSLITINGFTKKSMKPPKREIRKASRIKKEYFNEQENPKQFNVI